MAIRRVHVQNFRSIETLDLEFSSVNALVGANNSGKSNILRALNLVLGETWPSRPFTDKDFFNHDVTKEIIIQVFFANPLQCDADVHGFCLRCSAHQSPEFFAIDRHGRACTYGRGGNVKRVSGAMREEVALLYLGLDREAESQLKSSHGRCTESCCDELKRILQEQPKARSPRR